MFQNVTKEELIHLQSWSDEGHSNYDLKSEIIIERLISLTLSKPNSTVR